MEQVGQIFKMMDSKDAYSLFNKLLKLPEDTLLYQADYNSKHESTIEMKNSNPRLQVNNADNIQR